MVIPAGEDTGRGRGILASHNQDDVELDLFPRGLTGPSRRTHAYSSAQAPGRAASTPTSPSRESTMLPRSEYGDTGGDLEDSSNVPLLRGSSSLDSNFLTSPLSPPRQSLQSDGSTREALLDGAVAGAGVAPEELLPWWSRERFTGSVMFNVFTFLLPAIHMTLAKLWVSHLDSKMVVATDVYVYLHAHYRRSPQ